MALKPTAKFVSNKLGQIVTPVGSALFVSCPNASAFDEAKQEASLILSADDYAIFKGELDKLIAAYEGELVVNTAGMDMPVKPAVDKEGAPTGDFIIKAKTSMQYPAKLYSANGKPFAPAPGFQLANRSKIRLSVSAELVNTKVYKGLVLRLNGLLIISSTPWAGANPFSGLDDGGDFEYADGVTSAPVADDEDWA